METRGDNDTSQREVREHFFLPPPSRREALLEFDHVLESVGSAYQSIGSAFRYSVQSALSTLAMPFLLARTSVGERHLERFYRAAELQGRIDELEAQLEGVPFPWDRSTELWTQEACRRAGSELDDFMKSTDGIAAINQATCDLLLRVLKQGLESVPQELLYQGLVLLWSAFEVLYRDVFETLLNQCPGKVCDLNNHPDTRKRFEVERFPLDTLVQHRFDLSASLGTVLVRRQDFSDLRTIKAVYAVLYPTSTALLSALAEQRLWVLYQQRHLIVHKRGVIDRAYTVATGEACVVGERLAVTPQSVKDSLKVVVSCGTALACCLA